MSWRDDTASAIDGLVVGGLLVADGSAFPRLELRQALGKESDVLLEIWPAEATP